MTTKMLVCIFFALIINGVVKNIVVALLVLRDNVEVTGSIPVRSKG